MARGGRVFTSRPDFIWPVKEPETVFEKHLTSNGRDYYGKSVWREYLSHKG